MTHTPGPWICHSGMVWKEADGEQIGIAKMDRDEVMTAPTERDANARLIAAAPALLEALEALMDACDAIPFEHAPSVSKARSAIALAKGEEVTT